MKSIVFTIEEIDNGFLLKIKKKSTKEPFAVVAEAAAEILDTISKSMEDEAPIRNIISDCLKSVYKSELMNPEQSTLTVHFDTIVEMGQFLKEYNEAE